MDRQFWLKRRLGFVIGVTVLLLIAIAAYLDGGEEPVRPIVEQVDIPLPYQPEPSSANQASTNGRSIS